MVLLVLLVAVELALLRHSLKTRGFLPFPHGMLIYLILGQISIFLVANYIVDYRFLEVYSTYTFIDRLNEYLLILFGLFLLYLFATLPRTSERGSAKQAYEKIRQFNLDDNTRLIFGLVIALVFLHMLVLLFLLDWDAVWFNDTYLLMGTPDILRNPGNPLGRGAVSTGKLIGLISAAMWGFALVKSRWYVALLLTPIFLFYLSYETAAHSRHAVVQLGIVAATLHVFSRKMSAVIVVGMLAVILQINALEGRSYYIHGYSSLLLIPEYLGNSLGGLNFDYALNAFEGIFTSSEMFVYRPSFSTYYKIASFLPTPSSIDQFATVRDIEIRNLFDWVPASAWLEASAFGPIYLVWMVAFQLLAGRLSVAFLYRERGVIALGLNALMAITAYLQFAYPIRNVFRFYWIVVFVAGGFLLYKKWNEKKLTRRPAVTVPQTRGRQAATGGEVEEWVPRAYRKPV